MQDSKRLAKNTVLLYFRTMLTMVITLFTSRIVLDSVGVDNYGIYNVVGGIVAMFSVITGSLSISISRYITYELGRGDKEKLQRIFSTSINILLVFSLIIVILGETAGLWFLNNKMNIPVDRMYAANWVLQFSILTFITNLISTPYNAAIIAHERMSAFAYVSILEVTLKLIVVYLLYISPGDKLIVYAILLFVIALVIRVVYGICCKRNFTETKYVLCKNRTLVKEMTSFAGWSFLTNGAYIFNTQGVNILINLFFGVTVNAARGIAAQVETAIMKFANDFSTAINPQIIKSYAAGDTDGMMRLVYRGAKISYFLLLFISLPVILETDFILGVWLKEVPEHTIILFQLCMIGVMIDRIGCTTTTACMATGKIKHYTIGVSIVGCFVFPLTWLCFKSGMPVESTYIIYILVYIVVDITRMIMMRMLIKFSIREYLYEIYVISIVTTLAAIVLPLAVSHYMEATVVRFFVTCFVCVLSCSLSILFIGFNKNERKSLFKLIRNKIHI